MSHLFDDLPDAERTRVLSIIEHCPAVVLPRGTRRTPGRIPAAELLIVEKGLVALTSTRPATSRRMLLDLAGEGGVLLPPDRSKWIEALEDACLTAITPSARDALLRLPGAAEALVEALSVALRSAQESLAQFASVRHVDRVREKLLQLARDHGRVAAGGIRVDVPLTHELIGEMVGSARETVTWAVNQLAREGFLIRDGRLYRLSVPPELLVS